MSSATVTQIGKHRKNSRKIDTVRLGALANRFKNFVPVVLDSFFIEADDFLFKMADSTSNAFESGQFFEQLRALRLQKNDIRTAIINNVDRWLNGDHTPADQAQASEEKPNLSLLDDVALERTLAIDSFAARTIERSGNEWLAFHERMLALTGEKNLSRKDIPFNAEIFGEIVLTELETLESKLSTVLMLFRKFDGIALPKLLEFYQRSNVWLIEEGVLPNLNLHAPHKPSLPTHDPKTFATLGASLASAQGVSIGAAVPGMPGAGGNGVMVDAGLLSSMMASISQLQAQTVAAPSAHNLDALKDWTASQAKEVTRQTQGTLEAGTVSLVAMLFEYILDDKNLSAHMKQLLARMQIPIIKVAILDKDFFTDTDHSARLLLNRMARSATGWNPGAAIENDMLLDGMEKIVSRLAHEFDDDVTVFDELLTEFDQLLEGYEAELSKQVEEVKAVEQQAFEAHQKQDRARIFMDTLLANEALPDSLYKLLDVNWYQLMRSIFNSSGESKGWKTSGRIAKELVWSLQPSVQITHRARFEQLVPKLLEGFANGLKACRFSEAQINSALAEVKNYHALYAQPLNESIWEAQEKLDRFEEASKVADAVIEEPAPLKVDEPVVQIKNADLSYYMDQVESLSEDQWFDIEQSDGSYERGRLSCIVGAGSKYVFTNYAGEKIAERSAIGLAMSMRNDQFRLIAEDPLFDRMIDTLVEDLGQDSVTQ
ncbi:DUF1631 family protein [Reinekea marinisedimentorum]|uniref:Uncharacterized protein DUF1631 n=1 Tax=Reinekea marinisedimentorum TaxID=230495 RepID=A0A4R3IBY3_9GAMM|nr:DUF1631 family protein [Reinekea marinisedimentorum]TCS44011.1 uncharacterized protein DUF1631 [Reinekea marinisedimentorum]